jgi:hypothetical protein
MSWSESVCRSFTYVVDRFEHLEIAEAAELDVREGRVLLSFMLSVCWQNIHEHNDFTHSSKIYG